MKIGIATFFFSMLVTIASPQCFAPTNLFADNINYYNAEANWGSVSTAHYYRIRYKEMGSPSWSYANNIDSSLSTKTLTNLTPLSDYIWQIKSYCDSTNTNTSSWSVLDTFTTITSACPTSSALYTTTINYNNALANWDTVLGANRYKIRYAILGTNNWSNLGPIHHPTNSVNIPLLNQNTSYEWQVLTYHDSSTLLGSLWSASDTFTTTAFIPANFNPLVSNNPVSLECNMQTELFLEITQTTNEPDIATGTITSDGGYFNISSINTGDSIGYIKLITATQTINTTLLAGMILGQNYAIINSYDSAGTFMGLFTIENDNGGIKVEVLGSPNDGNNYTSGYTSKLYFTDLFVNPPSAGPLHFFANISSELNDQTYAVDTVQIWCGTTGNTEESGVKKIIDSYNMLGQKINFKKSPNIITIVKLSNGKTEKRIFKKQW
tara:strand:+ start:1422 stop:2732 length:1311 start_codon:yes stop_codon:yes gene_type:complete